MEAVDSLQDQAAIIGENNEKNFEMASKQLQASERMAKIMEENQQRQARRDEETEKLQDCADGVGHFGSGEGRVAGD